MVHIFYSYLSEQNHKFLMNEFLLNFPDDFQKRVLKFRFWQDSQLCLLGRLLLSTGLKNLNEELHIRDLNYTSYNKPYFKDEKLKFNISHSGNIVVCVITETCEVGIDIEIVEDIQIEDFKSQMTELEWRRIISSSSIKKSFFDYWTQKEAVIKAHGMGLSIPLKSFEITDCQTKINEERFFLEEIKLDNKYKCYLALKNEISPITLNPQLLHFTS